MRPATSASQKPVKQPKPVQSVQPVQPVQSVQVCERSPQDCDRILTRKGYAIKKSALSAKQTEQIRTELLVSPKIPERFAKGVQPFQIYAESPSRFYLPRAWATAKLGAPEMSLLPEGLALPAAVRFKGTPYDYQDDILQKFTDAGCNGLLCVPCGKGKTFMALAAAVRLGRRFMVVVDKEFFLNQWRSEMETFVDGLRVGILQGSKAEIDPAKYDCLICMLQTLALHDYPEGYFDGYGLAIFDECHKLGAPHFSKALGKIQPPCLLGLSATPTREDGLTFVFESYLGRPVHWDKTREADPTVEVRGVHFQTDDVVYREVPTNFRGEPILARLLSKVVEHPGRTAKVVEIIRGLTADSRRKILILSERKILLENVELALRSCVAGGGGAEGGGGGAAAAAAKAITVGYYVGGMKQADLDATAADCQVILATYAMANEGLNIKTLNAVVLASPRKRVEQSTGRILRMRPEERSVEPLIVDIVDPHDMYKRQWKLRLAYYKKCGYNIQEEGRPAFKEAVIPANEHGCMLLGACDDGSDEDEEDEDE